MKKFTAIFLLLVLIVSMFAGCQSTHRYDETETYEVSDQAGATVHDTDATLGTEDTPPNDTGGETETDTPGTDPATTHNTEATDHETVATEPIESSEEPTHSEPSVSGNEVTESDTATEPATEPVTEEVTEPPATDCSHTWSEWKTSKAASCTKKGTSTRTCTKCGANETKDIPATGHNWKETSRTAATCTKDGAINYKCSNSGCNETKKEAGAKATGHTWDKGTVTKPTCTKAGYTTYKCTVCGETKTVTGDNAAGHSWKKGTTVAPTCTSKGYTNYTCSKCGEAKQDDWKNAIGHDYKTTTTAPTCTQSGHTTYTCSRCGHHYEEDGPAALGHAWEHHDEVGHEVVQYTCSCGAKFYSYEDWNNHFYSFPREERDNHGGYEVHREWIVDSPAYDICTRCHARK